MSSRCAAASALKLMASVLVQDNAKTSKRERESATEFVIPLMCGLCLSCKYHADVGWQLLQTQLLKGQLVEGGMSRPDHVEKVTQHQDQG